MNRVLLSILLILSCILSYADHLSFNALSRKKPVTFKPNLNLTGTLTDSSVLTGNIALVLTNDQFNYLFLKVEYIINHDTLTDYIKTGKNYNKKIKTLIIEPNTNLIINLYLNNTEVKNVIGLNGTISFDTFPLTPFKRDHIKFDFTGSYWDKDLLPLFQFSKEDTSSYKLTLNFAFNENYCYDKLFVKIKIVNPEQGIIELDKEVTLNQGEYLKFKPVLKKLSLNEATVKKKGYYYIQIKHVMKQNKVNGIDYINFELAKE